MNKMRWFALTVLDILGGMIEYCVTRKCWMCGGTGETELYGITVKCGECDGEKRL